MPSPFPRPALAGTVSASYLSDVETLYDACRQWGTSLPLHLPYIDLAFSFGFATLGDEARARKLLSTAWEVMRHPVPPPANKEGKYDPILAATIPPLAYRAFANEIERVIAGRPFSRTQPEDLLATSEHLRSQSGGGVPNRPAMARYLFGRLWEQSRILDPAGLTDVYATFTQNSEPHIRDLADIAAGREPAALESRIRRFATETISDSGSARVILREFKAIISLTPRVSASYAAQILDLVPAVLASSALNDEFGKIQLFQRAFFVTAEIGRADVVSRLSESFVTLAHQYPDRSRLLLVAEVGTQCLRTLQWLGLRGDIERVFTGLRLFIPEKPKTNESTRDIILKARLALAAARLTPGSDEPAMLILDESRGALLGINASQLGPKDYTELARAYANALGQGDPAFGLSRLTELFKMMPRGTISNTFTTARYFSRFHLILTEAVVAAAGRMLLEPQV
jgi:hypothetical protein